MAVQRVFNPQKIFNAYGPAETVISPTVWDSAIWDRSANKAPVDQAYVSIGRVVGERTAYVLDANLAWAPPGGIGELYLGGIGLARGYLNRPGLTAERFIADPQGSSGERLYRTGDLVRWNAEGQLDYFGRIDHQVKIRGFRIELGEIEAQLLAQPEVRDAVVVAQEGPGGARLVGYVALRDGQAVDKQIIDRSGLRARLSERLPDYMVPGAIVVMDRIPLNANGKVDRKALPAPEMTGSEYAAPQGEVEETLAQIWAEVLGVERVGRQDNFFELGGDSLLAIKMHQRITQCFAVELPLRLYFEKPKVATIGDAIQTERQRLIQDRESDLEQMAELLDALEN
ncbi:MAG: AMP-binding protein [Cellvibrionaceae bacterium]|nr:AMP-binding protein [Cellvibrionaceae bacterium]